MGTPILLTPALQAKIVADVEKGHIIKTVVQAAGISRATYFAWMSKGSAGEEPYAQFFEAVNTARARSQINLLNTALAGDPRGVGSGPARAAQWALERMYPKEFGSKISITVEEERNKIFDAAEKLALSTTEPLTGHEWFIKLMEAVASLGSDESAEQELVTHH
jgi:hypothetical protein